RELAQMERQKAYLEGVYRNLVEQLQDVRMREQTELGYADRVNEAFIPSRPSSPDVQRNLMLAVLMGLLLGGGGAFLRDRMDSRLYKPEDVRAHGHRVLSVVPNMNSFQKEHFNGAAQVQYKDRQIGTGLVSMLVPAGAPAEAYRHLRTNLQFARPDAVLETVMITSPGMGDGKSMTAANLAIVMAQSGNRTLLLDADLRRPQVHALFGMERGPGLSDHLREGADSPLSLQRTVEPHLYALPAGSPVGNPSELLGSPAFRNLMMALRDHFDYIVVDTPPVLAATDATLLSTQCDATVMVTRAAATMEAELDESLATLQDVGSDVEGIVFNAFDVSMAFGYKMRYRQYDAYGHYGQYESTDTPREAPDEPRSIRV
ncbi:MAG: polysaccharide biosynthesis tyrosine autokinase, partial [Bacteroidetes bacterium]|nr:polysaccharide biosynthesis tyrosine autokinase [Bacteroidota bacterium]